MNSIDLVPIQEDLSLRSFLHLIFMKRRNIISIISQSGKRQSEKQQSRKQQSGIRIMPCIKKKKK